MGTKSALTRALYHLLPKDERTHMSEDLIGWIYTDLPPSQRQKMIEILQPNLLKSIHEGRIGLSILIYRHFLRIFTLLWRRSDLFPEAPPHLKSFENL